jgi:putative tricarboxylic transport membrane protein
LTADRIVFVCTIVIGVVYLYATTQLPTLEIGDPLGPRVFPLLLGACLLGGAVILGFEIWRDRRKASPAATQPRFEPRVVAVLAGVTIWTGAYYLAFDSLGYVLATTLYLLPLTAYFHPGHRIANIATPILFSALTYWLFVTLDVRLPKGVLPF